MEVQQNHPHHPHSLQDPDLRGFCYLHSLDSPREYSWDTVFSTLTVYPCSVILIMLFCVLWGFVALSACFHGILNSSGYSCQGHATKPIQNSITRTRRIPIRRCKKRKRKRFALGHAVLDVPVRTVFMENSEYSSSISVNSMYSKKSVNSHPGTQQMFGNVLFPTIWCRGQPLRRPHQRVYLKRVKL